MRFLIALIISIKGIGLSEHIITNHVQSDPDELLCRKGYNFLLLLSGIANSGLVGRKEEKQKVKRVLNPILSDSLFCCDPKRCVYGKAFII